MADEKVHVFSNSVKETLRVWPVLTLARQHGFCGSDAQIKEEWLCECIIQIFKDNGKCRRLGLYTFIKAKSNFLSSTSR